MPSFTAGKPETRSAEFFVPAGAYKFRVIEAKEDSSATGNETIKLKLRIIKKDGSEGPSCYDYLVFTQNAKWKVDNFLKSCGRHPGEGETVEIKADETIGWEGEAQLKVEEYQGNKNNKVVNYLFEEGFEA